jgi:hypothetical protein
VYGLARGNLLSRSVATFITLLLVPVIYASSRSI